SGRRVAQRRGTADVGLELDLRIRLPVSLERPDVLECCRMVAGAVRPGERHVIETVEVQVTVLEPVLEALVRGRELRGRNAVHERRPRTLLEAIAVGELAERAAGRVIGRAGDRAIGSLCGGILADGAAARPFTGGGRAFRAAHAGVKYVRVAVGLATREGR